MAESQSGGCRSLNVFWPNGPISFSFVIHSLLIHVSEKENNTNRTRPLVETPRCRSSSSKRTREETEVLTWKQWAPKGLQPVTVCVCVYVCVCVCVRERCVKDEAGRRAINHIALHRHIHKLSHTHTHTHILAHTTPLAGRFPSVTTAAADESIDCSFNLISYYSTCINLPHQECTH